LGPRSLKLRLLAALDIVLALGFLTDSLAWAIVSRFPATSSPLRSVPALAAFTLLSALLLVLLIASLGRLRGESLREICLGSAASLRREAALGVALVPGVFLVSFVGKSLARHFLPGIYSGERNILEDLMHTWTDLGLFTLVALGAGGFREELQRAFVIRRFTQAWGPAWLGAALFALYFGYGHLVQGKDEAIIAGILGLLWGALTILRRSFAASAVSHGLYDALELARYFLWGPWRYL